MMSIKSAADSTASTDRRLPLIPVTAGEPESPATARIVMPTV